MKDNIKIILLAIIAGTLIYMAATENSAGPGTVTFAPLPGKSNKTVFPEAKSSTFDPLTPPAMPPPATDGPSTTLGFITASHDFGGIKQNSTNTFDFTFTNTGKVPLVITDAVGSCGCTVPDYPKRPIMPDSTGVINVVYKPGMQQGNQHKTVTVTANTDPTQTVLRISADVQKVN